MTRPPSPRVRLLLSLGLALAVALLLWPVATRIIEGFRGATESDWMGDAELAAHPSDSASRGSTPGSGGGPDSGGDDWPDDRGVGGSMDVDGGRTGRELVRSRRPKRSLRGRHVLHGAVLDPAGLGVVAAYVRVTRIGDGAPWLAPALDGAERLPPRWSAFAAGHPGVLQTVVTGEAGMFRFDELESGWYAVDVLTPGYAPGRVEGVRLPPIEPSPEGLAVKLAPGGVLTGTVTDENGEPMHEARIVLAPDDPWLDPGVAGVSLALTDRKGEFDLEELPVGGWRLAVLAPDGGRSPRAPAWIEGVTPGPGFEHDRVDVSFEEPLTIAGVARVDGWIERKWLEVLAVPVTSLRAHERGVPLRSLAGVRRAPIRLRNRFTIEGLAPGVDYLCQVVREGMGFAPDDRWAEPRLARSGDDDLLLDYSQSASVEVHCEAGAFDYRILGARSIEAGGSGPFRSRSRVLRLGGLRPLGDPDDVRITLLPPRFQEQTLALALDPATNVDLGRVPFDPAPLLRMRVVDGRTGEPVRGAELASERVDRTDLPFFWQRTTTARGGVGIVRWFGGNTQVVAARARGYAPTIEGAPAPSAGDAPPYEMRLEPEARIEVLVEDLAGRPIPAFPLRRASLARPLAAFGGTDGAPTRATTGDGGSALFDGLGAGAHDFRAPLPAGRDDLQPGRGTGRLGGMDTVVMQVSSLARTEGRVRLNGTALAGATVSIGDAPWAPSARTDAAGRFDLRPLWQGRYALTVRHPALALPAVVDARLARDEAKVDARLLSGLALGIVETANGLPLGGVSIRVVETPEGSEELFDGEGGSRLARAVDRWRSAPRDMLDLIDGELGDPGPPSAVSAPDGTFVVQGIPFGVRVSLALQRGDEYFGLTEPFDLSVTGGRHDLGAVVLEPGVEVDLDRLLKRYRSRNDGTLCVRSGNAAAPRRLLYVPRSHPGVVSLPPGEWAFASCRTDGSGYRVSYGVNETLRLRSE